MMSCSRIVFHIHVVLDLLFALGLCSIFHSQAPTTCSRRKRERTIDVIERKNHWCDVLVWASISHSHGIGFYYFALGLCLFFHSRAPTTCSRREK